MILPSSYLISMLLLIAGLLAWGSWPSLFKAAGKWRFELFCFDFAIGALLAGLIAALTLGSFGWDGFSLVDDVRMAGKRQELYAFLAGMVFNLGNMLLIGAISVSGISVAFPVGLGIAMIVSLIWNIILDPISDPLLAAAGCAVVAGAVVFSALSHRALRMQRLLVAIREGRTKSTRKSVSLKPIAVAAIGGIVIGSFFPLLEMSKTGENSAGPYTSALVFGLAIFVTTFIFNLFLMNLPINGQPVEFGDYFKGSVKQHAMGIAAGALLMAGVLATLVADKADGAAHLGSAVGYAMVQGAIVVGTLWGLVYWKEFGEAEPRVRTFLIAMAALLIAGVGIVVIAPLYGKH